MPSRSVQKIILKKKAAKTAPSRASAPQQIKTKGTQKATKKTKIQNNSSIMANTNRMAVNEQGIVIQASENWLDCKGRSLQDILEFSLPEESLHDRPSFGGVAQDNLFTNSIIDGEHDVILKGTSQTLYFERLRIDSARSVILISNILSDEFDIEQFLNQTQTDNRQIYHHNLASHSINHHAEIFSHMTHDLMVLMNSEGHILDMNETFRYALDYTMQDISDFTFMDLVHPDDRAHVRPTFKSLMQGDTVSDQMIAFECRVMAKDQSIHWLEWRMKRNANHLYAICRDLTYIKESDERNLKQQQQLSEAQRLGRMGHWTWRVGDQYIQFSDEIYRIFGVNRDEFVPTIESVNGMLHRRDVGRMAQGFQRAMIEQKNYDMEFRIVRPNGQARFIQLQGRCEFDSEGEVTSLFGIMQDVTERTQHERELREAKDSAERAYAAKSQFLANMSHELRTPLNAIIGFSEMMQRQLLGPIGTEKYLDYIGGIRESGEHLLDLISDILDMSKIEAGKYELDIETFNMMKVLRLGAHMIEGRALDAQVKIISNISEDFDLDVVGDRRAVMQVILNILSNAVKFTEPGGEVRISESHDDCEIRVEIQDTGIGIPASKLRYVTEPFEQAANHFTRNHEGSGLGLAITKDLIELHGGALTIQSTVGIGTIVSFTIPRDCTKKPH
jgi:two-component system cell cycle sensor histidine kinase PleC